jgi:ubiquinol-cytochrome c reductase cytochrome b subunit
MVLPFAILGLIISHILILHEKGSSSPLGTFLTTDKIAFFPYYVYKDIFGLFCFFIILILFISFSPNFLVGHPDNYIAANALVTPLHIVPEWYFLPYYAILRSIPDKLGGVLAMGGAMAIFFFKGLIDNSLPQALYFRPFLDLIFFFFLLVFIFLKILGGLPIEEPFASISQNMALIYFIYLTIIVYLIVLQENRFYLPLLNNKN